MERESSQPGSDAGRRAWLAARRRTLELQLEACSPRASRYRVERIVRLRRLRHEVDSALRATAS